MFREKKTNETIADLVKNARKEKGLSARKLATLLNVSHTEINNIESGIRVKPSIIVLKGIEQYLDVPFSITAKLAGYSDETVKYGEEEIRHAEFIIDQKRHIAMDIEEYFKDIHEYLKSQSNVDEKLLRKADSIERFISEIERKYESILKEK